MEVTAISLPATPARRTAYIYISVAFLIQRIFPFSDKRKLALVFMWEHVIFMSKQLALSLRPCHEIYFTPCVWIQLSRSLTSFTLLSTSAVYQHSWSRWNAHVDKYQPPYLHYKEGKAFWRQPLFTLKLNSVSVINFFTWTWRLVFLFPPGVSLSSISS